MQASIKQMRDRMAAGTNLSQPVPVKPAAEAKKADKGA
jgi:hypothetical protein